MRLVPVVVLAACVSGTPRTVSTRTDDFPMVDMADVGPPISARRSPIPDDRMKEDLQRRCIGELVAQVKACIGADGVPTSGAIVQSSGYADYDWTVQRATLGYTFRPYVVDGVPTAVCAPMTFVYRQDNGPLSACPTSSM